MSPTLATAFISLPTRTRALATRTRALARPLSVAVTLAAVAVALAPAPRDALAETAPPAATTAPAAAQSGASPGTIVAGPFTAEQKKAIEGIIRDYLVANPELFLEVQTALEQKMEKLQAEKLKVALAQNADEIFRRKSAPTAGNPSGDVTVVEFFDYNCGYCKRGLPGLVKLIEKDPKIKVVFKELPILSKGSEEASRVALAAGLQGKYWDAHRALLEAKGQLNEATALKAIEKLGLDMARLKRDMAGPEVKTEIEKVRELAQKMGINGTPHFLVGERSVPGAPDDLYEQLAGLASEVRKTGCSVC